MKPLLVFVHGSAEMYGSDKVLLNLARATLDDERLHPVVVLHEDGPLRAALEDAGVEVHVATVVKIQRSMLNALVPLALARQLRQACADLDRLRAGRAVGIVYSNTLAVLGGAIWAWRRGLRHVWHVHEIILKPALVSRGLPWLASMLADRVISNSRQTEGWLFEQAPRLRSRGVVIFNGLATPGDVPPDEVNAMRRQLGASEGPDGTAGDLVATVAGRLNHWKGQDLAIEALALLRQQGRLGRLRLAIVGDVFAGHDDVRSRLVAQVDRLGLQDRVSFVPFVDNIYAVWRATDIAVVPSLEPEPFGMVAIEAMACGLPVIAAGHGGLLDIVQDGATGLLFKPRDALALADALAKLAVDAPLRQRLGDDGKARQSREFSLRHQVELTRLLCHELLPV